MQTTFKVELTCGCVTYRHKWNEAVKLTCGPMACDCDGSDRPKHVQNIWRVALTPDAFERAANGQGGYEQESKQLYERNIN